LHFQFPCLTVSRIQYFTFFGQWHVWFWFLIAICGPKSERSCFSIFIPGSLFLFFTLRHVIVAVFLFLNLHTMFFTISFVNSLALDSQLLQFQWMLIRNLCFKFGRIFS
jgi:hypothetical protein